MGKKFRAADVRRREDVNIVNCSRDEYRVDNHLTGRRLPGMTISAKSAWMP